MPEKYNSPWSLEAFLDANTRQHTLSLSWQFRLELMERVAKILSDLHRKNKAYGYGELISKNVLIQASDRYGLKSLKNYPTLIKGGDMDIFGNDLPDELDADSGQQDFSTIDQLCLGVLLIEMITQKPLEGKEVPQLVKLLRRRALGNVKIIHEENGKRVAKTISNVPDEALAKSATLHQQAQEEFVKRELIKEDMMRKDYDPEAAAKSEEEREKNGGGEMTNSRRGTFLKNIANKNSVKKAQKFLGKVMTQAKEKLTRFAKQVNERRKHIQFPRFQNFNRVYIPDENVPDDGRISRNLLKEKEVTERKVDEEMEAKRQTNKRKKNKKIQNEDSIQKADEYVLSAIIKAEVKKYLNPTNKEVNNKLQKPTWLLSLFDLIYGLVDSVDDSRPSSKVSRNWILEVMQSFEKSKEKHEEVKKLINSEEFEKMNEEQHKDKLELSETMKKGDYITQFTRYDLYYKQTAVEIILDDVQEISGEVLIYHSKDVRKDLLGSDDEDSMSDDSAQPPLKGDDDYQELLPSPGKGLKEDFPEFESPLLRTSVKNTGKPSRGRISMPKNRTESQVTVDLLVDEEPPPIIGPKADAILGIMAKQRQAIGQIPKPKHVARLFDEQKKLKHNQIVSLLKRAKTLFDNEPNIVNIDAPAIVVGDIHGQYFDLRQIMKFCGKPKKSAPRDPTLNRNSKNARASRNSKNKFSVMSKLGLRRVSKAVGDEATDKSKLVFNQEEFIKEFDEHKNGNKLGDLQRSKKSKHQIHSGAMSTGQPHTLGGKLNDLNASFNSKHASEYSTHDEKTTFAKDEKPEEDTGKRFLFLGDYVDRGAWSCEVFFYLLSIKVQFPDSVVMLRGNHECDTMAETYGFREECEHKYGREVYHRCIQVFSCLPIACLINLPDGKRFMACHGGITEKTTSLEDIARIERRREPGLEGVLCDLLWADPVPDDICEMYQLPIPFENIDYIPNETRGCAKKFGYRALERFLQTNQCVGLIRAHEAKEEGFQFHFQHVGTKDHVCITVFSAPNYMNEHGNKGAVLIIHKSVKDRLVHQMKRLKYKYTVDQVLKQQDKIKDAYLDILEPICYHEVAQPEVVAFENENLTMVQQIEDTCPYMPTIIDDFYNSSLDILERYGDAQTQLESYRREAEEKAKRVKEELEANKKEKRQLKLVKGANYWQTMRIRASARNIRPSTKKLGRSSSQNLLGSSGRTSSRNIEKVVQHEQFAAAQKKTNETHPQVMNERIRLASSRMAEMEKDALQSGSYDDDINLLSQSSRMLTAENLATLKRGRAVSQGTSRQEAQEMVRSMRRSKKKISESYASEVEEDNRVVVEQIAGRAFMKRERVEMDFKEEWVMLLSSWFSAINKEEIMPDDLCHELSDCVLLCEAASMVLKKNLSIYRPKINSELSAFEVRRNLIVFQDACKSLGIHYMFLVFDLENNELSYVLPALAQLAKKAKQKSVLEFAYEVEKPEKLLNESIAHGLTSPPPSTVPLGAGDEEDEKWRTKGLEVGNVTFNGEERLMLQLLFLMIDLDDTGFITEDSIIAWAREEGKLIRNEHAEKVISAIDYDADGRVGLRDFFQYAAKLKEEYMSEDFEDYEEYDTADEGQEDELLFHNNQEDDDGGFQGIGDAFDPTSAIDISRMHLDVGDDSSDEFRDAH